MKKLLFALALIYILPGCQDLDEINENPNQAENVSSNYILTYVISETSRLYESLGHVNSEVSGAMQYNQSGTNNRADEINFYNWSSESWATYYDILRNVNIIHTNSLANQNEMFEAISLTMRAFLYGTMTDLFGDIPYSESVKALDGVYFPKYDEQKEVYKGILEDLKNAESILSGNIAENIDPNADLLYSGNAAKWRMFANSLRMRYSMRLINKKADMSSIGVDVVAEFNNAANKAFQSINDDAQVNYIGTTAKNSFPGGGLNSSNPPYSIKMCKTMVDVLLEMEDPRVQRWLRPVTKKWDFLITEEKEVEVTNMFGDTYTVTYLPTTNMSLDTSLYVGLPVGIASSSAISYNSNDEVIESPERSPYISFMHERFFENDPDFIAMNLITYSEVEFLLSEAAQKGGFSISGTAEEHYINGIKASLSKWGVQDGTNGFGFADYYQNSEVDFNGGTNKLERIMNQKWIASFLSPESWFDWRRTGFPDLKTGPVNAHGSVLPVRFMYPSPSQDDNYIVNYNAAVERLESTNYVSTGQSKDHSYSKMWLLQGTGYPW